MNIEEKAKRYDEAIEIAKEINNEQRAQPFNVMTKVFPELAESEDEKIRKNIIATIHLYYGEPLEDEAKEMIDWLEKQGEHQKFIDSIQIGDKVKRNEDVVLVNLSQLKRVAKKDEKQVEQTSADETPYPETLEKAIDLYYYSYGNGEGEFEHLSLEKFRDIVHTFVSDYGQKPAWSEEELDSITAAINNLEYLKNNYVYHQMGLDPAITFLKSLKDRVQPKQEWSEDGWTMQDEEELQIALDTLVKAGQHSSAKWLKNVCLRPQNTWKPSKEQLRELRCVISGCSFDTPVLVELEEDLKKLMEE